MSIELQLAALLCSRVCHDLINPIGALNNGLEFLEEDDDDPEMRADALRLLKGSGQQASAKLPCARLAFGASSSGASDIERDEARRCIEGILAEGKAGLTWDVPSRTLDKDRVKIVMNAVQVMNEAIPYGGALHVSLDDRNGAVAVRVSAEGREARVPGPLRACLDGTAEMFAAR